MCTLTVRSIIPPQIHGLTQNNQCSHDITRYTNPKNGTKDLSFQCYLLQSFLSSIARPSYDVQSLLPATSAHVVSSSAILLCLQVRRTRSVYYATCSRPQKLNLAGPVSISPACHLKKKRKKNQMGWEKHQDSGRGKREGNL